MRIMVIVGILVAAGASTAAAAGWRDRASAHVAEHQTMPRSAEIRGDTCRATVRLELDGNGLITSFEISRPCKSAILTRATDDLFFRLPQMPAPPARKPATVNLPVVWPPEV